MAYVNPSGPTHVNVFSLSIASLATTTVLFGLPVIATVKLGLTVISTS